jgi:hypothetical protein
MRKYAQIRANTRKSCVKMPRKTKQLKVDPVIAKMNAEDRAELDRMCREHANVTAIHRWLEGFAAVSYRSVLAWYQREWGESEQASALRRLIPDYRGIDPLHLHAAALAYCSELSEGLIQQFRQELQQEGSDLTGISEQLIKALREQRQSALALLNAKRLQDTKALELAGGYRVVEIVEHNYSSKMAL